MFPDRTVKLSSFFVIIFFLILFSACSSGHQILKYQSHVTGAETVIPGIEPEESSMKILVLVRGKGVEPDTGSMMQKKFMAERAAVIDGYRRLSERLAGMYIDAHARSGRNSLSMDEVMIETRAYLRGAQVGAVTYQDGFATAEVKVYMEPRKSAFDYMRNYF